MAKYCRYCGTTLSDETTKCWSCGLALGVSISPQPSSPELVEPRTKVETPALETPTPPLDIPDVVGITPPLRRPPTGMESCEIIYENSGMSIRRFVAKVTGPNGAYEAGRSRNLTGEALFDILDDMAGEKNEGPSNLVQANAEILLELVAKLMRAGWEPMKEEGEHWWSKRFVRVVETNTTPTLIDSPQIWEPWFQSAAYPAFERKLVHMMGFDGKIRLFEVRTNDAGLDALLNGRLFLDFYVEIKDAVFLRQIRAPEDWPQTSLMYLDLAKRRMGEVLRSDSTLLNWTIDHQTDSEFTLITERRSTASKGYTIRHRGGISFELFTSPTR